MALKHMAYIFLGTVIFFSLAILAWTLGKRIWSAVIPPRISNSIIKMRKFVKKKLAIVLHRMFYRKLEERYRDDEVRLYLILWVRQHLLVIIMYIWGIPWVLLSLHYLSASGCEFNTTRPYMETCGMCLPPTQHNTTWFLKLWDNQANITDHSEYPSFYIRTIMTSHLEMYNAQLTLQDQVIKLRVALLNAREEEKVMHSLKQSINIASNLTTQMHSFALALCMEKEIMTSALHTFINVYSKTITTSNYEAVSLTSIVFCPWGHSLRFLNRQWLSPWLLKPQIYSFEIEAELRFQKTRLTNTFEESLALLHANSPTIENFNSLEVAISLITSRLRKLKQTILESDSSRRWWSTKSDETLLLQNNQKLLKRTQHHLVEVLEIAQVYKTTFSRLWNDLKALRQSFSKRLLSRFASTGSLAVPEFLLAQGENVSFVSPWQSSSIDQDGDGSDVSSIPPATSLFGYSLNNIKNTQLSAIRSAIARHCKASNIENDPEDNLYTICTIYKLAAMMSGLDNHALSSTPRSWMVEMEKAIHVFDKERGFDLDGVQRTLEKLVDEVGEGDRWI